MLRENKNLTITVHYSVTIDTMVLFHTFERTRNMYICVMEPEVWKSHLSLSQNITQKKNLHLPSINNYTRFDGNYI